MTARVLGIAIAVLGLSVTGYGQGSSSKDKEETSKGETFDGYGGDSKRGTGPGISVTAPADDPNQEKVQTNKKAKTKPKKAKPSAEKVQEKEGGAQKTGR